MKRNDSNDKQPIKRLGWKETVVYCGSGILQFAEINNERKDEQPIICLVLRHCSARQREGEKAGITGVDG